MERARNNFANPTPPEGQGIPQATMSTTHGYSPRKQLMEKRNRKKFLAVLHLLSSWCRKKLETCLFFNNANNDYL